MTLISELLGWAGAGCLLLAYALVSAGRLCAVGHPYQLLNLAGSVGLAINGALHRAWPSTSLNLLWIAVGLSALIKAGAAPARKRLLSGPVPNDEQGVEHRER